MDSYGGVLWAEICPLIYICLHLLKGLACCTVIYWTTSGGMVEEVAGSKVVQVLVTWSHKINLVCGWP